jgi:lysophospholipase L1-like esterase
MRKLMVSLFMLWACAAQSSAGELILKTGSRLAFLGDSITAAGAGPSGYARLVVLGLEANGVKVEPIYSGVGGNKSSDMLARVDRDVLTKKPHMMTLSCGGNDVWFGIPLEQYRANITALVDKVQAAGVKPVLLTWTVFYEDPDHELNQALSAYNEFLRTLAKERSLPLADLNSQMHAALKKAKASNAPKHNRFNYFTIDGRHMAPQGDQIMAEGILRTFGMDDAQIAKAKAAWLEIPNAVSIQVTRKISLKHYQRLGEVAAKENLSIEELLEKDPSKMGPNF